MLARVGAVVGRWVASDGRAGRAASVGGALALGCVGATDPLGAGDGTTATVFVVSDLFFSSSAFFCSSIFFWSSSQRATAGAAARRSWSRWAAIRNPVAGAPAFFCHAVIM